MAATIWYNRRWDKMKSKSIPNRRSEIFWKKVIFLSIEIKNLLNTFARNYLQTIRCLKEFCRFGFIDKWIQPQTDFAWLSLKLFPLSDFFCYMLSLWGSTMSSCLQVMKSFPQEFLLPKTLFARFWIFWEFLKWKLHFKNVQFSNDELFIQKERDNRN